MKKIHFLLLIFILFLTPNVFASDYKLNSHISATSGGTKNRYGGLENYTYGSYGTYTFGTRYQGRLGNIETYIDYPFEANTTYTLTYNMNTEDFINHFGSSYWWDCSQTMTNSNATVQSVNYISYKKIKFTFTPTSNTTCIFVSVRSTSPNNTAITQITNWQLDSIYLYDPDYQGSGGSGGSGGTPTPTPDSNQQIIDSANQNTSDIIENNNQNTQDIINNQNNNTFNNCTLKDYVFQPRYIGYICNTSGGLCNNNSYFASDYVRVKPGYNYTINFKNIDGLEYGYMCWYNNEELISCSRYRDMQNYGVSMSVTPPDNANKLTLTYRKDSGALINGYVCTNPETDVSDALTSDNVDSGTGSSFFNDFEDEDFGLSSIITIPLNTIQSLTSQSCVALSIPIPFTNSNVSLPCMTEIYQQNIPTIYNLWKIVSFGIIAYFIAIDIFHMVKGFKDPESDKVEVLDL